MRIMGATAGSMSNRPLCLICGAPLFSDDPNDDRSEFCSFECVEEFEGRHEEPDAPPTGSEMRQMAIDFGQYDDDPSPYGGTYSEE